MSLFVAALNSGSNGNCYYAGNCDDAVLIDAGLSCRETEKRMSRLGLRMENVRAVFISHEHNDHIFGVQALAKKYHLPVFITDKTRLNSYVQIAPTFVNTFCAFEPVQVGSISVYAFPKHHDAADPHSFIVSSSNTHVGIFTDIGMPCNRVIDSFGKCQAVFLESNYDENMLATGRYPYHLKQRIRGGKGHLSNTQALQLYLHHRNSTLTHLFLSHLSQENNRPDIVQNLFSSYAENTNIVVASRFKETEVYQITSSSAQLLRSHPAPRQLSLF